MKKKLWTQMWNERMANLPLVFELFLISVALWFVTDTLYMRLTVYFQPRGFDISHTYLIGVEEFPPNSPSFDASLPQGDQSSMERLFNLVRNRPDVEAASLSYNSYPYNWSNSSYALWYDSVSVWSLIRSVSPDFFRVFRYRGVHGETPEQLAALFRNPDAVMVSSGFFNQTPSLSDREIRGKKVRMSKEDYGVSYPVVAVLQPVRYTDYQSWEYSGFFARPLSGFPVNSDFCIRVKAEDDTDFLTRFRKDAVRYKAGNLFVCYIRSFAEIRRDTQNEVDAEQKMFYGIQVFLLFNVFIALLGVFWYRTRQRRQEIAIQIAVGSSRRQIFMRLVWESLCLLCLATLPALWMDYCIVDLELMGWFHADSYTFQRFFHTAGLTFLLIAFTIVLSVWIPARRAMKIPPAEALHED